MKKEKCKRDQVSYHLMLVPGVIFVLLFNTFTWPGILMAFQDYRSSLGWFKSPFVGWENFEIFFAQPTSMQIIRNTVVIAVGKILFTTLTAILFSLLLNEVQNVRLKKTIQTAVYLPHFISWVIYATIMRAILGPTGVINQLLQSAGRDEPIYFLGNPSVFPIVMIMTEVLKEFGFSAIIYLSAITNIDPGLYEASEIDGANHLQQALYITLPGIKATIVLMATLSLGNVLNAGFDQIFNMYSPLVFSTGDILDTYVYRAGLVSLNFEVGTAVGLFKSVISITLMIIAFKLAEKYADYRIV